VYTFKNTKTTPLTRRTFVVSPLCGALVLKVFQRGTETGATPQNEATKDLCFWCFAWEKKVFQEK